MTSVNAEFCRALPKVELHAHLSGSVTRPILQQIWEQRVVQEPEFASVVPAPKDALADSTTGQSIGSFFAHFNTYIYHLLSSLPALRLATNAVLQSFQDDGVTYLELRTTPRGIGAHSAEECVRAITGIIKQWNDSPSTSSTPRMITRLILSIDQAKHDASQAMGIVDLALRLREEGEPIVGVDLCGDPNKPVDRRTFREAFLKAGKQGLGVTIHFAEVPASSSTEDLEEELSWNPGRLGHVIHVPAAMREEIKRRGIAVELCLTCNVLAGMLPSPPNLVAQNDTSDGVDGLRPTWKDHHFKEWWGDGVDAQLSLGTDDVGVFGSPSSEEHSLAAEHFGLNKDDLIRLSRDGMKGTFCSDEIRQEINRRIDQFQIDRHEVITA